MDLSPRRLSDSELIDRVRHLAGHERRATACLIAHLAELDERRLHVAEGCASLFVYCTEVLHLAEGAAYNRIKAARAAQKYPIIIEKLASGSVHVTAVRMIAPYLTEENHRSLLAEAAHKSKRAIEEMIARIRPREPVGTSVRKLSVAAGMIEADAGAPRLDFRAVATAGTAGTELASDHRPGSSSSVHAQTGSTDPAGSVSTGAPAGNARSVAPPQRQAKVSATAPDAYSVKFTADGQTYRLLCQARELLKHQIPDGDAAKVIALALEVLVEKVAREKLGATKKLRTRRAPAARKNSRHIPAEVKREVWRRDDGRCAFVAHNGRRCTERGRLEFHHVKPFALGGEATLDNIRLACRVHNVHESEVCFGPHAADRSGNSSWDPFDSVMPARNARRIAIERSPAGSG